MKKVVYLGDGLYAEDQGFQIKLFTQQDQAVYLDLSYINELFRFIEHGRNIRITVDILNDDGPEAA